MSVSLLTVNQVSTAPRLRVASGILPTMLGCIRPVKFPVAMLSASIHHITLLPCDQSTQVPVHATMPRLGVLAPYSAPRAALFCFRDAASEEIPE